jgi:hypothetical protein
MIKFLFLFNFSSEAVSLFEIDVSFSVFLFRWMSDCNSVPQLCTHFTLPLNTDTLTRCLDNSSEHPTYVQNSVSISAWWDTEVTKYYDAGASSQYILRFKAPNRTSSSSSFCSFFWDIGYRPASDFKRIWVFWYFGVLCVYNSVILLGLRITEFLDFVHRPVF